MADAEVVLSPGAAARRLGVSPSGLRRLAGAYGEVYGDLPKDSSGQSPGKIGASPRMMSAASWQPTLKLARSATSLAPASSRNLGASVISKGHRVKHSVFRTGTELDIAKASTTKGGCYCLCKPTVHPA